MAEKSISHEGIVESLEGKDVKVKITSHAACLEWHARGACNVTGEKNKFIRVSNATGRFRSGDKVKILLAQSHGFHALFLGYVLPFFIVLITLIAMTAAGTGEGLAGLVSLATLPPYYLILRMLRNRLDRRFSLFMQKV